MFHTLQSLAAGAVMERTTLLLNHVLASEPVAAQRLREHAGRCIQLHFDGWPSVLPPWPPTAFVITAAGLVEWCGADVPAQTDLRVGIDASNPALALVQAAGGERPRVEVAGDATLASDVNWLFDNLRWDVQDDLARLVGDAPSREIARIAGGVAAGLRQAVSAIGSLAARARPGADEARPGPPPR